MYEYKPWSRHMTALLTGTDPQGRNYSLKESKTMEENKTVTLTEQEWEHVLFCLSYYGSGKDQETQPVYVKIYNQL